MISKSNDEFKEIGFYQYNPKFCLGEGSNGKVF